MGSLGTYRCSSSIYTFSCIDFSSVESSMISVSAEDKEGEGGFSFEVQTAHLLSGAASEAVIRALLARLPPSLSPDTARDLNELWRGNLSRIGGPPLRINDILKQQRIPRHSSPLLTEAIDTSDGDFMSGRRRNACAVRRPPQAFMRRPILGEGLGSLSRKIDEKTSKGSGLCFVYRRQLNEESAELNFPEAIEEEENRGVRRAAGLKPALKVIECNPLPMLGCKVTLLQLNDNEGLSNEKESSSRRAVRIEARVRSGLRAQRRVRVLLPSGEHAIVQWPNEDELVGAENNSFSSLESLNKEEDALSECSSVDIDADFLSHLSQLPAGVEEHCLLHEEGNHSPNVAKDNEEINVEEFNNMPAKTSVRCMPFDFTDRDLFLSLLRKRKFRVESDSSSFEVQNVDSINGDVDNLEGLELDAPCSLVVGRKVKVWQFLAAIYCNFDRYTALHIGYAICGDLADCTSGCLYSCRGQQEGLDAPTLCGASRPVCRCRRLAR